jgi:TfoX/Sxy family transcriptional regulator of competence genes
MPRAPALIAPLSRLAEGFSGIERRKMFGYPALFINGNMFAGLVRDTLVIPLLETNRQNLIAGGKATPFVALGCTMREWVALAPMLAGDQAELRECLANALAHTAAVPPKNPNGPLAPWNGSPCGTNRAEPVPRSFTKSL